MVEVLDQLEALTEELVQNIHQADYVHLTEFVEIRDQYMSKCKEMLLSPEQASEHREQIGRILSYDHLILKRLTFFKEEASLGLKKIQLAKRQQSLYDMDHYTDASLFYDTKK